jgi:hypothetical protein
MTTVVKRGALSVRQYAANDGAYIGTNPAATFAQTATARGTTSTATSCPM